jgi:hypothetical protein
MVLGILKCMENVNATRGLNPTLWKNVSQTCAKMAHSIQIPVYAIAMRATFVTMTRAFSIPVNQTASIPKENVNAIPAL